MSPIWIAIQFHLSKSRFINEFMYEFKKKKSQLQSSEKEKKYK